MVRESSKKTYERVYRRFSRSLGDNPTPEEVQKFVKGLSDKPEQRTSYLNAYQKALEGKERTKEARNLDGLMDELKKDRETKVFKVSKSFDDPRHTFKKVEKTLEAKPERTLKEEMVLTILYLLEALPPLRNQDYVSTRLDGEGENTLDIATGKWVLGTYKTSESIKGRTLTVPDKVLNHIVSVRERFPEMAPYMFVVPSDPSEPMSSSVFSKMLKKELGATMNALRKIFVSRKVIDGNLPANERTKIAKEMGHSTKTQGNYYSQNSLALHGSLDDILKQVIAKRGEDMVRRVVLALL